MHPTGRALSSWSPKLWGSPGVLGGEWGSRPLTRGPSGCCEGTRRRGCSLPRAGLAPAHGDGSRASQGPRPWCPRAPGGLSAAWPNRGGLGSPSGPWLPPVWEGGSSQGPAVWLACLCQPSERVPSATLTPGDGGHEAQSLPRAPWGSGPTTGQGCRVGVHSLWTGGGAPHHRGPAPRLWAPLSPLRPRHCHRSGTGDHSRGRSETNTCSRWTAQQRGSGVSGPGFAPCVRVARRPVCPKPKPHLQMGPSMCSGWVQTLCRFCLCRGGECSSGLSPPLSSVDVL